MGNTGRRPIVCAGCREVVFPIATARSGGWPGPSPSPHHLVGMTDQNALAYIDCVVCIVSEALSAYIGSSKSKESLSWNGPTVCMSFISMAMAGLVMRNGATLYRETMHSRASEPSPQNTRKSTATTKVDGLE